MTSAISNQNDRKNAKTLRYWRKLETFKAEVERLRGINGPIQSSERAHRRKNALVAIKALMITLYRRRRILKIPILIHPGKSMKPARRSQIHTKGDFHYGEPNPEIEQCQVCRCWKIKIEKTAVRRAVNECRHALVAENDGSVHLITTDNS